MSIWMGHFDLTNFMGIPGQFENPDYLKAVDKIVQAAKRHGKIAGMMAADENWARDYLAKGFRIIAYGVDHLLLQRALGQGLSHMRAIVSWLKLPVHTAMRTKATLNGVNATWDPSVACPVSSQCGSWIAD